MSEEQKAIDAVFMEFGGRSTNRTIYEEQMATEILRLRRGMASHLNRWMHHLAECEVRRSGGTQCTCGLVNALTGIDLDD